MLQRLRSSMSRLRGYRPTLIGLAIGGAAAYAVLVAVLAWRRWGCDLPFTAQCVATWWRWTETFLLFLWVDDWEGLLAGIATLLAAIIGASAIYAEGERRASAQLEAERAVLAHRLKALLDYAAACIAVVSDALAKRGDPIEDGLRPLQLAWERTPDRPSEAVDQIRRVIALADVRDGRVLSRFLLQLQVQHARLDSLREDLLPNRGQIPWPSHFHSRIGEALALHAAASELYPWARSQSRRLPSRLGLGKIDNSSDSLFLDRDVPFALDEVIERARKHIEQQYPQEQNGPPRKPGGP